MKNHQSFSQVKWKERGELMRRKLHTPAKQLHICTKCSYFLSKHHQKIMVNVIQLTFRSKLKSNYIINNDSSLSLVGQCKVQIEA